MMEDNQEYFEGLLTMFVGSPEKIYTFAAVAHASPMEQRRIGTASAWEKTPRDTKGAKETRTWRAIACYSMFNPI